MRDFNYYNPSRILFGRNALLKLPQYLSHYQGSVLFHYGQNSIKENHIYDKVITLLQDNHISYIELGGVSPNPTFELVNEGISMCKKHNISFILAVGGGSVIDSAKAIAAGVYVLETSDYWNDYFMKELAPDLSLPVGVILTMPASGSEVSYECVITNKFTKFKRSMGAEHMIPRFAIINPEFHITLPAYETACGCADILSHLMERYFTQLTNVDLTDRLLEACMRTVINYTPLALKDPSNYDIRAEIAWSATIAHNRLLDTGRRGDWASHEIQHSLGAFYNIRHGEGLSVIFPAWMKYVWNENPFRFIQFAQRVWNVDLALEHEELIINKAINSLESFLDSIGLATHLYQLNIDNTQFDLLADNVLTGRSHIGRFKKLEHNDIVSIYQLAQ
ncbi:MAG: iron-containing alcohol dehydrogenase [Herbinix sp.]|nr:iron-containing alcohol dehydrogenase [Herbinix sp.]